jgi:5-methylcytosine-specific restriction protein A
MAEWPYSTGRWQRLRALKLARDPLCEDCRKIGRIDRGGMRRSPACDQRGRRGFPPLDELSSKCWPCHSRKTARGAEAGAARSDKPMKGCAADGSPLDASHPWNN